MAHWRSIARRATPPLLLLLGVLACWQLAVNWLDIPPFLLPTPWQVATAAFERSGRLFSATAVTALAALSGLALSLATGLLVAMLFSQSPTVRRSCFPYAIFLQTVPIVAIAPVLVIWLGEGFTAVVAISFIVSLFPIITNTTLGLISVSQSLQELFRLNAASRWQMLVKLQLPAALPQFVAGAKISSGAAVLGAIVGEYFAGAGAQRPGLGYLIFAARGQFRLDFLFAAVLASTALGVFLFAMISVMGDRWLLWWCDPGVHEERTS